MEVIPQFEETQPLESYIPKFEETQPLYKYNQKALFSGDPLSGFPADQKNRLNETLKMLYDDPAPETFRIANSHYLAEKLQKDPKFILEHYDDIAESYFGKKLSPDAAYKEIARKVNPEQFDSQTLKWLSDFGSNSWKSLKAGGLQASGAVASFPAYARKAFETSQGLNSSTPSWEAMLAEKMGIVKPVDSYSGKQISLKESWEQQRVLGVGADKDKLAELGKYFIDEGAALSQEVSGGKTITDTYKKDGAFKAGQQLFYSSVAQVPNLAAMFLLSLENPAYALAWADQTSAAAQYQEVKDNEKLSDEMKLANSFFTGKFERWGENLGTIPLFKSFLLEPDFKKGMFSAAKNMLKASKREGASEAFTQFGQNAVNVLTGNTDKPVAEMTRSELAEELFKGIPDAAMIGAAIGGGIAGTGHLAGYSPAERDEVSSRLKAASEDVIKRNPDSEFAKKLIEVKDNPDKLFELWQSRAKDADAINEVQESLAEEDVDAVTDSGSHAPPTFTAPDSSSSGLSTLYDKNSEKSNTDIVEAYKAYLDNRLESGQMLVVPPEHYDMLVESVKSFPLNKSFSNRLGENISFAASPGQSPLDYIHHFIAKRNHNGVNAGKESFSEDHLTDYQRMIDTFENYDERILGEYKGQDRVYYVKHLSDPADKRNPEHLFIVGVDDSGRAVGFKLVADNQFSTRKNYVEKMRTIEKDLISERGLRDSSGFGSDFTYDDYLAHKDDQPFYLKRPADQDAELKPETDAGILESLSAAAEKSRAVLEGKPETAISKDDVRKLASEYFPNRQIELIDSDAELKSYLLKNGVSEEDASEISSQEARGIWVNGIIVIRPDYIETKEEAVKTLIHEIVGHDGLRGVFGSDFKRINNMLADHYRIDKTLPDWERLAEERFAEESETIALNPKAQPGRIRRVWTSLKLLFSRYFKGIRFSDRDIASIVRMSYKYAQKTELQQIGNDIRYSLAGANSVNNLSAQEREAAKDSIFKAVIMETRGESADKIRLATGWYRSKVDSRLRYEIDDSGMKILPRENWLGKLKKGAKLSDIIEHTELFKFYPDLANIKVKFSLRGDAIAYVFEDSLFFGEWINDENSKGVTNFRQILLHELQHLIQYKEGFARGGSPQEFVKGKKSGSAIIDGVEISDAALQKYFNLAGEKEARDTQSRADMDVRERKLYKPFGVDADKKAIVRYSLKHENEYDSIKKDIEANPGKYRDAEGRLLAPNGNPSKLNEQQYIQVRTASFKEWFGDWELSRRMEKETVVTPVRDDVLTGSNIKELRESANKLKPEILGSYLNSDQQWEIEVNDSSFTHAFYNLGSVNIHLVPSLPDLVKNAVLLESEAHQPPSQYYAAVHRFYSAITFRNKLYAVKLTVKEHVEKGRRLYDHQATEIEEIKTPSGNVLPSDDPQGELNGPALGGKISISRLLKNVKEYNEKLTSVSKAVDENGEPLVVYHGSAPDKPFSIFRRRYERDGFKSSSEAALNHRFGIGIFFSSNSEVAKDFGNNVRSFFLNIRWLMENNLGGVDYYDGVLYDPETGEKYLDDDGNPMKVDSKHLPNEAAEDFLGDSDDDTRGIVIRDVYEKIPIKGFPMPALQDTWIVGSPFQIKSATDNIGSFDKANPDIRYSLKQPKFVGSKFGEVFRQLEPDNVKPKTLSNPYTTDKMRIIAEAGELFNKFPESVTAADGRTILIKNPDKTGEHKSPMVNRLIHLLAGKDGNTSSREIDPVKAKWFPAILDTLEKAQIILEDSGGTGREHSAGNLVYVRKYTDKETHFVVVSKDGVVKGQDTYDGGLLTQFPKEGKSLRDDFEIKWERKTPARTPGGSEEDTEGLTRPGSTPTASDSNYNTSDKKVNNKYRAKKADKPLAQLTEEERIFHFAVLGAEKIARGYKNAAVWQDRMITDFGIDIKPQLKEIYKQSLAILQRIKEKTGTSESKSQYVNDFIGMFTDEMYETDKSDMQFDSRVVRLVKNGSPEELLEAFEYVEGVLAKEKSGKAQNIGYIDSLYDLGKKLADAIQKSNQDIHELRKKARAEKLKRKKENAADVRKAVLAFAEEQKEQEEEKKEDWRAQNERNYDRWKEENYPLIWSIEDKYHGLIKASSRFAGQQEDFKGASYVSFKEGYPSNLAADELGMDEDSLMEYLQDISRSRLRNEFSRYQKQMSEYMNEAKSEEAKAGDAVSAALTEAKREAFGKGWRKGYGDANRKSSERIKELQTLLRSDLDDIGNLQGKLRDYIKKFIPQEYRAKLLDSVVKIARASARPTAKNPFGARKVLFEATLKKISELSEKYEKDSLIEKINDLLDRSAVRKDKSGRPVGKLGADDGVRLSEIRRITRMSPEAVELDLEESVQKLSTGGEGNLEEDKIEKLERHIADMHMFGSLSLKTVTDLKEAQENLDELIENGRTVYDQAINERNAKRKEEREKLFNEISGGKGLMSANAEAAAAAKRSKAGHLTSYNHMRNLSFEWLMNAITRKSNSETLGGFAHELSMDVHEATIREESGIRSKSDEFNEAFKRIFKAKTWFQFKKKMEACREIKENSGVIVERGWTIKEETIPLDVAIKTVEYNELIRSGKKQVSANDIDAPRLLQDYQLESLKQQIRDYNYKYSKYQTPVRGSRENEGSLRDEEVQERVNERELDNKDNINCKIPVKTKSENVDITQENLALSQDTALYMWLMKEQKDVKYRMEINGWTEESFKQLEAFLLPETLELGKWMREELANDKDSINAVFERDYHIRLPDVENYFPVRNDVASGRADSVMLDSHSGISSLIPGSFISRVHNFSEPKFASATGIYAEHFAQMEHFKAWSGTMIRLRGIFQSRSVRKAIEQNVSPDAYRVMQERLNYFADGGNRKATSHYWLDVVRSNFVAAKLIYSVSVFISQLTSYPAYMLDIPISSFVKYQAQFFLDPVANYAEIKDIMASSEYFRNRFSGGADRDVMAYLRQCQELSGGMPGIIEKTVEAGAITNKIGDAIPALAAGWSVYKYHYDRALNQGMNKDEAREHAITEWGMATDRSLQGGHLKDQGIYQAGGSVEKLFTMFLSAPRLYYQHVSETLLDAAAGRKGARKDLGRKAFIALVVLPVLLQASKDFLRYLKEGDDFELELRDYLLSCFLAPVTGIYLLGTAADLGARYLFGNSRQIGDFSPVFSSLKSAAFTVRDIQKFFDDKDSNDDVLKVITEMSDALAPASKSVGLFSAFLREGKRIGHWFGFFEDEDNLRKKYMRN